jgi:iron(III) transport system permease protein
MGGYFLVTAVLPVVGLVILSTQGFWSAKINKPSFDNYAEVLLTEGTTREALRNSIMLALIGATVGVLVAAIIVAYSQRRVGNPFARGADTSLKLPGAVSHILIGVAFITAFAGPPFGWHGTLLILVLAYIVVNMPQASVNAGAAFAQVDGSLMEASRVSGRSEGGTFARVTLPLMVPGLAAGWAMVFVLMAGDITVSSMLAGAGNPVVGYEVLQLWEYGTHPLLAALAISSSILWTIVVLTVLKLTGSRRLGLGGS